MDALGINVGLLLIQFVFVAAMIGLPVVSLIDLARKKLPGTPLALWVLVICVVPVLGSLAYWIIKPTAETAI
jgi:phospholipase D-like protein